MLQVFLVLTSLVFISGCGSSSTRSNLYRTDENRPLVEEKYKVMQDRQKLEELRGQLPPEKKVANDELAHILDLFADPLKEPTKIREKFDSALRKKRELFSKDMTKEREEFTKKERKDREKFLKDAKEAREDFLKTKPTREQRDDFFSDQDEKRRDYMENQRELRSDFEGDVRERRKSFDDYAREKQTEFTQEHRAFVKRHEEAKKEREKQKKTEAQNLTRELDTSKSVQGKTLESGE